MAEDKKSDNDLPDPGRFDKPLSDAFERLEEEDEYTPPTEAESETSSSSGIVAILALILALIAIGLASYVIFQDMQSGQTDARAVDDLRDLQSAVKQQKLETDQQLSRLSDGVLNLKGQSESGKEMSGQVADIRAQLQALAQEVGDSKGASSQDWLMAEVEYLVRLANQRVLIDQDGQGAVGLLLNADQILAEAQGFTAFELRKALAEDISALRAIKPVDTEGVFLRIHALMGQISSLKQKEMLFESGRQADADAENITELSFWMRVKGVFTGVLARLGELVDFRRLDNPIAPVLPASEDYFLRENLRLVLQQAQVAMLRRQESIYWTSLDEALGWIGRHFDLDDPVTVAMVDELQGLQALSVAGELPQPDRSLKIARELMRQFHQSADK